MLLNSAGAGTVSGAGGVLPIPPCARGTVGLWAHLAERSGGAPHPAGTTYQVRMDVAWKASPWGAPAAGPPTNVPVADGTGQGTGFFRGPGRRRPAGASEAQRHRRVGRLHAGRGQVNRKTFAAINKTAGDALKASCTITLIAA